MTTPMSNWDASVVLERLRKRLAEPPLKLTASGGGLGLGDPHTLVFDHAVLVERAELENVVRLLGLIPPAALEVSDLDAEEARRDYNERHA